MTSIASVSSGDSTIYTPTTSSESGTADLQQHYALQSDIPTNGSTFIIQDTSSGHVISWHDGDIVLAPISNGGICRWKCVETEGWFCFLEPNSKKFLCFHGWSGQLMCNAAEGDKNRHFGITLVSRGGFVMSMLHWFKLRPIVTTTDNSKSNLALAEVGQKLSDGIIWKFIAV
jgi:hypothetical protein